MKNVSRNLQQQDKIALYLLVFMLCTNAMEAQNTSYNTNSIPIGGSGSTAFGFEALKVNTGLYNTATGFQTLRSNTTGSDNTANGYTALYSNTTGLYNTANGHAALTSNTSGSSNTANGYVALTSNTTGFFNSANGFQALFSNTTGYYNSANGALALFSNTSGNASTANGYRALFSNQTGSYNIAVGDSAGYKSVGNRNIFLGRKAGYNETADDKLYISNDVNKTILYGDMSTGQLLLGNSQPTGYTFKGTRTLNVLGGILADSVRVALSGDWSDYVFADNYTLRPLHELEKFIQTHKHLPNIPSATAVATNGINVAEMDARLLEKIEELTLYILQQQKQVNEQQALLLAQQKQVTEQQALLLTQQKQIDKLLQLVNNK